VKIRFVEHAKFRQAIGRIRDIIARTIIARTIIARTIIESHTMLGEFRSQPG
jgi:hypothetical protein